MNTGTWLCESTRRLANEGIATPRLDALVLLEDCLGINRARLLAEPDVELSADQKAKLEKLLNRRTRHEPLAYIRGKTEFYGREFVLTAAVLEPRPESETMINLLKALPLFNQPKPKQSHPKLDLGPSHPKSATGTHNRLGPSLRWDDTRTQVRVADVGTGSGALGITAKLELPSIEVDLLEIDNKALKVAKINVDKFTISVQTIHSDLLEGSAGDYDILLCNLPYVPDDYSINQAATHEPRIAIFGGPDGLDVYRQLFQQVSKLPQKPLFILTESLPPQHTILVAIASAANYYLTQTEDFIQVFKNS